MDSWVIDSVPSRRELGAIWICYAFFAVAIFMWWPAVVALIICYAKRGEPNLGVIDSHYRWLIATFWWWFAGLAVCVVLVAMGASPLMSEVIEALRTARGNWDDVAALVELDWSSLFWAAGATTLGAFALFILWIWVAYRIVRGVLRLAHTRTAP